MQKNRISVLLHTNWLRTIRFNFYYFPFRQAIKFPVLVAYHVVFQSLMGG